ncbi:bifunctional proline dehydrogenase/L-glutamate gamma-semialdehyde dehydrogenase PutA [Benzoatithermus flavus]|uniref:Bifunctional protein PutA n=1 Tax=Benzoatithermus flavus TaxID=3108223 RepID=A0ABU8XP28_9PROT
MPSAFLADLLPRHDDPLRRAIDAAYHRDETDAVEMLLAELRFDPATVERIQARARRLAHRLRAETAAQGGVEAFMHAYSLDTHEGVMLMCLAEALLRVPDAETQEKLIRDKIGDVDWQKRVARSESFLVNASAFGLMLSGRVMRWDQPGEDFTTRFRSLLGRLGEPVVREAMRQAMRILGQQFVLGQTIDQAIERAKRMHELGFRYSYDMLGEGAKTAADAARYFEAYHAALQRIAATAPQAGFFDRPSLSIKLSALHPRYEFAKWRRLEAELLPGLVGLLKAARAAGIAITIDAEESERLEPSLDLIERLATHPDLMGWNGLGLAVQAYQKRALYMIPWLAELARRTSRQIPVRLVKGAYWDTEIKHAQVLGVPDFPVFTRKVATDVSYLACAKRLLEGGELFYPQFATHNAHTIAAVIELAGNRRSGFEFQKLHGMGEALYRDLATVEHVGIPCRVYAPVGSHKDLLPYLVRRLLENGANSSFVHQVVDPETSLEELIADPVQRLRSVHPKPHPKIRRPPELFAPQRKNAVGIDLSSPKERAALEQALTRAISGERRFVAKPGIGSAANRHAVRNPADRREVIGEVAFADAEAAERALAAAHAAFAHWGRVRAEERAAILERAADLLEAERGVLLALCVKEAGKTIVDSVADWREAIDFLRYYAAEARRLFAAPMPLPGPTGEDNRLRLEPRGVFVAISPWNFPIAIFTGQIAAALAAGNTVIAKPAEATALIAEEIISLLHKAGVPEDALIHVPGEGHVVGPVLVGDPRTAGVVFTGSTETAWAIQRTMAAKDHPIRPLIAETGGLNAMIVDNTALPEQVVTDAIESAFRSAGQRCSALRVLFLQEEIAPKVIDMLTGAMAELQVGDPARLDTDVGPVIEEAAKEELERHVAAISAQARLLYRCPLDERHAHGSFVAPTLVEIDRIGRLEKESFGPILHVVRYPGSRLDQVVESINATGFGLTFGIHSRIDETIDHVVSRVRAGNIYVNRNIIGAVVGSQPFGGEGLSGTGFKAGGPYYLLRFAVERTVTVNTAAVGGNLALLGALEEEGA